VSKTRGSRERCRSRHALAIARWEENSESWREGKYFELTSRRSDLQDLVGDGGTLWVIVSRRRPRGGRTYSLSFRLDNCQAHTYRAAPRFGPFAVRGDDNRSTLFASNDAALLLLGLRFDPVNPIDNNNDRLRVVGQSIQRPRCLNRADVELLRAFGAEKDRWSIFLSYQRTAADTKAAKRLAAALQAHGRNVFRDQEALRAGQRWWPTLQRAIGRARHLVVLIGPTTHESTWVTREVRHALRKKVHVIPVVMGGSLRHWASIGLNEVQGLTHRQGQWHDLVDQVLRATQ